MRRTATLLLLGSSLCLGACAQTRELPPISPPPEAQSIAIARLRHALPEPGAREVRVYTVDFEPGGFTPAHRHPGAIVAYVLEGSVLSQIDSNPAVRYEEGQTWFEPASVARSASRNASITQPARLLIIYLTGPGLPLQEQ